MTKRPTAYCDRCESTVYTDDVHSCFDAKLVRTVAERERAVIDAAVAWDATKSAWRECDEYDDVLYKSYTAAIHKLLAAVRSLQEVMP